MINILLVGNCGSGKTWVMKQLIKDFELKKKAKVGMVVFQTNDKISVLGNYDGSVFEGSDKLSMAVMSDCDILKKVQNKYNMALVCEGDRFTNSTFINKFRPVIIKITDDGSAGRLKRNSNQTERHLKAIQTRVNNTKHSIEVKDSNEALLTIKRIINENTTATRD
jgi:hypothetical protein